MSQFPPLQNFLSNKYRLEAEAIDNRISPLVERLEARWLRFCEKRYSRRVKSVHPRDPASLAQHKVYGTLKWVKYYDLEMALDEPFREGPLVPGFQVEEPLRKAVLTWCTCQSACIAFWNYLLEELGSEPDLLRLEWSSAYILPRIVLFSHLDPPGQERHFRHDFLVLKFQHDISFVFDLFAYQFGLPKVLYTMMEYEKKVLDPASELRVEDAAKMIKMNTLNVMVPSRSPADEVLRKIALQLLDFRFEL